MFRLGREKAYAIKENSKKGVSLVIVVCVSAFLVAFALAMVYTAGLMLSQANRRLKQEQSFQLARTFSRTLGQELRRFDDPDLADDDSFYLFVCRFLEDSRYLAYNPDYPDATTFHYSAGESPAGEGYGDISIALYKESEWENDRIGGSFLYSASDASDPLGTVAGSVSHYSLTVVVTASIDDVSYSYSTVYNQQVSYDADVVFFTLPGQDQVLRWDPVHRQWIERNTGNPCSIDGNTLMEYEIRPDPDKLSGCKFTKAIPEKGDEEGEDEAP